MPKIFIGHGRSPEWRELQQFLSDRLGLPCDEFEALSVAGKTITERLDEMLNEACFAFLVMTAEEEHANGSRHARENVIHEVGLFQGRLGHRKAIVLLEESCTEFSNIHGLIQIRFPTDNILARSEQIRAVLKREGILNPDTSRGFSHTASAVVSNADPEVIITSYEEVDWKVQEGKIISGPYCSRCRDLDEKDVRFRETFVEGVADMSDVKYGGYIWYCPACNANYDRNPALDLKPGRQLPKET